jgi:two-component system, OmpR family, sensor histidine kinase BaeS
MSGNPRHAAGRRARARFFRRIAVTAVIVLALASVGFVAVVRSVAGPAAPGRGSPAVVALLSAVAAGLILLTYRKARGFASPLGALMDAADRVAEGDYSVRVQTFGPPPLRALAGSFNTMTERLQNADRVRRDLMADVAHELRTPLSVLQGRLEGLLDGVYTCDERQLSQLLEETRVLSRLVEDLRTLALSDAGALPLDREPADVAALARDVAASMEPEAARRSIAVHVNAPTDAVADIDPVRVREVLTNLLANAVRHSPAGRAVTVSIAAEGPAVVVTVADTGEGMDAETRARLFDRFHKGPGSRGSGLGLAIAKGIVVAHGGTISAASTPGEGTVMTFSLPAAEPSSTRE